MTTHNRRSTVTAPLMVTCNGAKVLITATEEAMPGALRRCLIHRSRILLARVPENAQTELKDDYWAIFDLPDGMEPRLDTVNFVQKRMSARS